MSFAVVLVGGQAPDRQLVRGAEKAEVVIAADGGVRIARSHGLPIHVVIGDLDSASEGDLRWARAEDAEIVQFPPDKDYTDLELALDRADRSGVDRIVAIGVDGGRLDHELGNWAALTRPRRSRVDVHTTRGSAVVLHGGGHARLELDGSPGDLVSLIPRSGEVEGVVTTGLRWKLEGETLAATSTRGMSNEFVDDRAMVEIGNGTLMVVRPRVCSLDQ